MLLVKIIALLVALACVGYLGWKKPWMLIYIFTASLFLEISRTWFLDVSFIPDGISLTKISTTGLIITAAWSLLTGKSLNKLREAWQQPLTKALLIYLAIGVISIFKSNYWQQTVREDIRLVALFTLFLSVYLLSEQDRMKNSLKVLHWAGVVLVPLAIYEGITRHFLWYREYAGWVPPRVNTTFVDPNIFARYIVIAITANLILNLLETNRKNKWLYYASMVCLLIALWLSYSRAGLVSVVMVTTALLFFFPNKRYVLAAGISGVALIAIIIVHPAIVQRFSGLAQGIWALDPGRFYLWRVALAMFMEHPVLGVGLGAFQLTFETYYRQMMLPQFWVTRSHTSVLTVASELGAIGLGALLWLWVSLLRAVRRLRSSQEKYLLGVGFFLIVFAVFLSAQFEARFFEDPVIWLCMAQLAALNQVEPR